MKQTMIGLAAIGLAGCATNGGYAAPEAAAPNGGAMARMCDAGTVQSYVGSKADATIGAAILTESGARTLRWGPPNAAWTMDYRQDRVNVQYDAAMTIEQITCG
ncbi:I78 family peptidase inhibitor [Erythrobacter sp. sf7]|uniref:I78 family peptidase inhibitor n=1 Tax=Erythrobacter fulvus TaxID=2987523 RepID=A0ABT5JT62_9SPHN|nr:I78 family peptidase inhibitor [Erythrobacter fulvus]MDC8755335.1 I78 family peptidase inhibitor [Erythrobacter fulvus]